MYIYIYIYIYIYAPPRPYTYTLGTYFFFTNCGLKMLPVSEMLSCSFRTSRKNLVLGHSPTIWPV